MRTRSACRCLLCQLEIHLKQELCEARREEQYASIASSDPLLSGYPSASALSAHLRSCRSDGNGTHPADAILLEMLHPRHQNGRETLLRDVLLLAFIPALHSTARQLARRYPLLPADDTAQHLVASLLQTFDSPKLLARDSHLAFAISRMAKRSVFEWAERETRIPGNAERDEPVVPTDDVVWGIPAPLERAVLLRHFLSRCQREGVVTGPDLEILVRIKLEGNFAEPNGKLAGYPNALRQRIKRLLAKLRKAARPPSTTEPDDQPA
jgi:hypothetical protein